MNEDERFELYMQTKKKKIKQNEIAVALGVSSAWVCNFFANKINFSEKSVQQIKEYVNSK